MTNPAISIGLGAALGWLTIIVAGGFLVSWVSTDLGGLRRNPYVGVLTVVTWAISGGYLMWSDAGFAFWTNNWVWGVLGAIATGGFLTSQISRIAPTRGHDSPSVATSVWEGLVYGTTEGLLLSVLPAVVIWQWWATEEWNQGWTAVTGGLAALAASGVVIVVHHLGYRSYRSRRMIQPVVACLVLTLGFLLTGSPISAMGGHVLLHLAMLRRGMEMPPEQPSEPTTAAFTQPVKS